MHKGNSKTNGILFGAVALTALSALSADSIGNVGEAKLKGYPGERPDAMVAPVAPYAKFGDGLLSRTRPEGWLKKACEKQRAGLTSHPEALAYPYDTCLWAGTITRDGTHGAEWWRYEQTAYYTDGLLRLGYALGDEGLVAKGAAGVDYTLEQADAAGHLGPPCLWDEKNHTLDAGHEMWPMAVFFRAMKARYEATGDRRIPQALAKYYLNYDAAKIRKERNIVSVEGMLWTYGLTKDERLLRLAEDAWNLDVPYMKNIGPRLCADDTRLFVHGVTYSEEMKVPMLLAAYTGKSAYLKQAVNVENKLERDHLLADGCPSSTEHTRGNSVHWGHETCVVSDFTWSLGYFLETTGEARYADAIERCVFNAGLGAVDADFRSLQYFSNLNQFRAAGDSDHNPLHPGTTWMQYRPTHETECCAGNVHRILPNYVSRMWLRDRAGAPVAALYGPSSVDFGWMTIREETRYPFDGRIVFRFAVREPRRSAFTFRRPCWCKGLSCRVNGRETALPAGDFVTLTRDFADGDEIALDLPMETVVEEQPRRHYVTMDYVTGNLIEMDGPRGVQGSVVRRGPVVYAYPIPTKRTEDTRTYPNLNGKKSGNPDFKCWTLEPAGSFAYALASDEATFVPGKGDDVLDAADPMASVRVTVKDIFWPWDRVRTPDLPEDVVATSDGTRELVLVPYASTCLRLTALPVLEGVGNPETQILQARIDAAWRAGGGKVVVSPGVHRIGGLRLRSNVELHLASNAVLSASRDCGDYDVLSKDALESADAWARASTRGFSVNAPRDRMKPWPVATDPTIRWNNGVLRLVGATNVVISGEAGSALEGNNSYDPDGEEHYRGVHGISAFYSSNVVVRGIELRNTGNWATRFAYCTDLTFADLRIRGGHDGVHVRGCDRVKVLCCDIRCGDDAVAGFDNSDVTVEDCSLNTACSAFRFGGTHVRVRRCRIWGPAEWPFRCGLTQEEKRAGVSSQGRGRPNMLSFWTYFADYSQPIRNPPGDIVVSDCTVENADRFLHYNFSGNETWQMGSPLGDIRFERIRASGIGMSLCAYAGETRPLALTLSDCEISFAKPQPEFIRAASVGSVELKNVTVGGVEGPCVRSWKGEPKIDASDLKGVRPVTETVSGKFSTESI